MHLFSINMQLKKKLNSFAREQTISIFKKTTFQAISKKAQITNRTALQISKIFVRSFFSPFFREGERCFYLLHFLIHYYSNW